MYILIRAADESLLAALIAYLKRKKIWFKEFKEAEYQVTVTAEERAKVSGRGSLNPGAAWETCASLREVTHWDSLGRGPWRTAGVAGDCANPRMLSYISCPAHCPKYEPANVEAYGFLVDAVIQEHQRRIDLLRQGLSNRKAAEGFYKIVASTGTIPVYKDGRFVIPIQQV